MNVWEVEDRGPVEEEPPKRKRRTQNHDPILEREPAGDGKPWKAGAEISGNVDLYFYFYIGESGTILQSDPCILLIFVEIQFLFAQVSQRIRNFLSLHFCYVLWWRVKLKVLMGLFVVH